MTDFNSLYSCGDYQHGLVTGVIDIPMGSSHKIEWDRTTGAFRLDRVDPMIFAKPVNYGFIPQTLDEDGDELDILCVTREPLPTGLVISGRILGLLDFRDGDDPDYKIVIVPADDRDAGDRIRSLEDLALGGRNRSGTTSTTTKTSTKDHQRRFWAGVRSRMPSRSSTPAANAGRNTRQDRAKAQNPDIPFATTRGDPWNIPPRRPSQLR